jgi:hypothetical protein
MIDDPGSLATCGRFGASGIDRAVVDIAEFKGDSRAAVKARLGQAYARHAGRCLHQDAGSTALSYLIKPLWDQAGRAFKER